MYSAFLNCLYIKNTQPQLKFKINCTTKRKTAKILLIVFGENNIKINDTAINRYKIFHAPLNTAFGGVIGDLFSLS